MNPQRRVPRRPLIVVASGYTAWRVRSQLAEAVQVVSLVDDEFRYRLAGGAWDPSRLSNPEGDPVEGRLDLDLNLEGLRNAAAKSSGVWICTDPDRRGEWLAQQLEMRLADGVPVRRMRPKMLQGDVLEQALESAGDLVVGLAEAYRAERVIREATARRLSADLRAHTRLGLLVGINRVLALELLARREWDLIKGGNPEPDPTYLTDGPLTTARLLSRAARELGMAPRATMTAARWLYDLGVISFPWTDPVTIPEIHVSEQPPEALPFPPQMGQVWPSETDHLDLYAMLTGAPPPSWHGLRSRHTRGTPDAEPRYTAASLIGDLDGRGLVRSQDLAAAVESLGSGGLITGSSHVRGSLPGASALSPSMVGLAVARYIHLRCGARLDSAAFASTLASLDALAHGDGDPPAQVIGDFFHGAPAEDGPGFLELLADDVPADPVDWSTFVFHGERLSSRRPRGMIVGPCVVAGRYGPSARSGEQVAHLDGQIPPADLTKSSAMAALGLSVDPGRHDHSTGDVAVAAAEHPGLTEPGHPAPGGLPRDESEG